MLNPAMLEAALHLAEQGWHVLPCWPTGSRGKAPITTHGFHDATRDAEQIIRWWTQHPNALIGCPVPNVFVVLDIDPRNGGSVESLEAVTGPLPATLTVWSGRGDGGRHLYYRRPAGKLTASRLPKGIDVKASGYCIMPPSAHPATGRPYEWEIRPSAHLPEAAVLALRPAPARPKHHPGGAGPGSLTGLTRFVQASTVGERNGRLFWAACRAFEQDADDRAVHDLFDAAVAVGQSEREAALTIASAQKTSGAK